MRVLLVTGSLPPMRCGVGDYSWKLAKALSQCDDLQVGVLTTRAARGSDDPGVLFFPVMEKWGWLEVGRVLNVVRRFSPDRVHLQYPTQGYGAGIIPSLLPLLSFMFGVRFVSTWHELSSWERLRSPRELFRFLVQALLPGSLIVVRPDFRKKMHPLLRLIAKTRRIALIPNASAIPKVILGAEESATIRRLHLDGRERLIMFFGFIYPPKRVELLFEIADPQRDKLLIVGDLQDSDPYHRTIADLAAAPPWQGHAAILGFLSDEETASLLRIADAVVLPFREGGGIWNTSILAAVSQGTLVITTSKDNRGFDRVRNIYFANPDDVGEMRRALDRLGGGKRQFSSDIDSDGWHRVADQHRAVYGLSASSER